ncbi:MAG TPA: hypothetical protein PLL33_07555 [Paracoccus sp. (in: a-proteobacteria)]|nr:hypothetical protein [Paracoccus sp. (in: a-proteobacteria)]
MGLRAEHELHRRRRGRNTGLGLVLLVFAILVFGLSIVKIRQGDMMQGYDHRPQVSRLPVDADASKGDPGRVPVAAPGTPAAEALQKDMP